MSQAEIEARFFDTVERIRLGELEPGEAFAGESDWLLEVEGSRFLFHPGMLRWFVYDRLHDEWYDTGFGPGEALLVAEGTQAGALRVPQPPGEGERATVAEWCLVRVGERSLGVRPAEEVRRAQAQGWLPAVTQVWDGASGRWQPAEAFAGPAGAAPAGVQPPDWVFGPAARRAEQGPSAEAPSALTAPAGVPPALAGRAVFCGRCGARLGPEARFCGSCGRPV